MDFAIFAVAFTMLKLYRIMKKTDKNRPGSKVTDVFLYYSVVFVHKFIEFEKFDGSDIEKSRYAA